MNSVFAWLYAELTGRSTLGGGMLKVDPIDYRRMPIINPNLLPKELPVLERQVNNVQAEAKATDRCVFDEIIFDALSLTKGEREAVYEAVIDLVESRLKKADSFRK